MRSSARSNSSTHGVDAGLPQHCLQWGRETPSALQCKRPGRCSIEYENSDRVSIHRASMPVCDDDAVTVESSVETRYFGEVTSEQLLSAGVGGSPLVDVPRV